MNKEKFKKSIDEIKPSEELIRKTLMNIENKKEKKKINLMPFYIPAMAAICSIVIITTFLLNNTNTTINKTNNNFLNEITGEYTFEHVFDFNTLKEEQFDNIYVLKYGNKIEDNDYTIPYESYIDFIEIIQTLKDNNINTLQNFNEENYDKVVINNEKYFYIKNEEIIYYDINSKVHYSIEINDDQETLNKIKNYIDNFTKMRSIENFIEQTHINERKESTYTGMYLVEKTTTNGQWEKYTKSRDYNDYKELMTYIEKLRYNNVIKNEKPFDVSKYYGNMLITFEGYYMYVPESISGKILLYVPGWVNPIYYEIELQQKDYDTLESIKKIIRTKGTYTNAFDRYNPETHTLVDPNGNNTYNNKLKEIIDNTHRLYYANVGVNESNDLYITLKTDAVKNNQYMPMDTSKIEKNPTITIDKSIRDFEISGAKGTYYCTIVYVTNDKKIKIINIEDIIKTGDTSTAIELPIEGPVSKIYVGYDENNYMDLYAELENGQRIYIDDMIKNH